MNAKKAIEKRLISRKAAPRKKTTKWELRLYVAGQTPNSLAAFANLKIICEEHLKGEYSIDVIDLLENPQLSNFILGAYTNSESVNSTFNLGAGNHQAGIGIGFKHELRDIFFEYVTGTKSNANISGYSIGGVFKVLWPDLQIFARVDSYDPDTSINNDTREKTFYGVIFDWSKDIRLSADVQNAKVGDGAVTSAFYLHSMVNF